MTTFSAPGPAAVANAQCLTEVRHELEQLTWTRLLHPLTSSDAERYADLCELERELLGFAKGQQVKEKSATFAKKVSTSKRRQPSRSTKANPVKKAAPKPSTTRKT